MFADPDLIIYLWLIPIFLLLMLPLVLVTIDLSLDICQLFSKNPSTASQDKRQHPRILSSQDTIAEITVDGTTSTALVCNISKFGIKLKHLPEKLSEEIDKITITVRQYGIIGHNLTIRPRWTILTDSGYQVGAEIADAPAGWGDYLLQTERIAQS